MFGYLLGYLHGRDSAKSEEVERLRQEQQALARKEEYKEKVTYTDNLLSRVKGFSVFKVPVMDVEKVLYKKITSDVVLLDYVKIYKDDNKVYFEGMESSKEVEDSYATYQLDKLVQFAISTILLVVCGIGTWFLTSSFLTSFLESENPFFFAMYYPTRFLYSICGAMVGCLLGYFIQGSTKGVYFFEKLKK